MSNLEAYEANLHQRLGELKSGDQAYQIHQGAIAEAVIMAWRGEESGRPQRILDVGCGLGFIAGDVQNHISDTDVVGIDPSHKAIELARTEHPEVKFYQTSVESFADQMAMLGEGLFDQAIVNMVLHSESDKEADEILKAIKRCLNPEGAVILVVPTDKWIRDKLFEYAFDQGMDNVTGPQWIYEQIQKPEIKIPVKIRKGEYYPEPITVYYRTIEQYGQMLSENGFGVPIKRYSEDGQLLDSFTQPYWQPDDNFMNYSLMKRQRSLLLSLSLAE